MEDVSYSIADLGYPTIQNYFATLHTKDPPEGAGANLKIKGRHGSDLEAASYSKCT